MDSVPSRFKNLSFIVNPFLFSFKAVRLLGGFFLGFSVFCSCRSPYGDYLQFGSGRLYFLSEEIDTAEVGACGRFLLKNGFFKLDQSGVAQLRKKDGVVYFRFMAPENFRDDSLYLPMARNLLEDLKKHVFQNQAVSGAICDAYFRDVERLEPR